MSALTEDVINQVFRSPEKAGKVKRLLIDAKKETDMREVKTLRERNWMLYAVNKIRIIFHYSFHWAKPYYPLRVLKNILLSRIYICSKKLKFVLRGCELDITFKCNFNCCHCSISRLRKLSDNNELEPKEYMGIVDQAMKLGATSFGIEGGEPFVREDWDRIIEVCHPKYNHIIITTNGFLFNEEIAKRCSELGVDTINFSLDNGIPELHDLFRRKEGSFDRVMKGINLCRKYRIKVVINTVLTKNNLYTEGFRKILEFGEKERILVHILFAKAIGNFKDNDSMLDEDDFKAYQNIVKPYSYAFVHHETAMTYGCRGCNGTKEIIQITPYGDVMHCANMHIYFGNIKDEPLADIRERALKKPPFGKYLPCPLTLDDDFMRIYYPLLENKNHVSLDEFSRALEEYEYRHNKRVYGI